VSFILDADIRSFFDEISQQWLIRFLEHRIGDRRIIRLIQKWLKAGILEGGVVSVSDRGTGQGAVISPLLANIYLHYALDLWAARGRRRLQCCQPLLAIDDGGFRGIPPLSSAGPRCGLHIADERLAALVDVDMLDADDLRAAIPQAT
jgi:retron-type reverse transcriptase